MAAAAAASAVDVKEPLPSQQKEEPTIPVPVVRNVISYVDLGKPLPIKELAMYLPNTRYRPKKYAAVVIRLRTPSATVMAWPNGTLVVTGTDSADANCVAAKLCQRMISSLVPGIQFKDFQTRNMSASFNQSFRIRLEALAAHHEDEACCDKEATRGFPGCIYRFPNSKVTALIFSSGMTTINGCQTMDQLRAAAATLYPILYAFRA